MRMARLTFENMSAFAQRSTITTHRRFTDNVQALKNAVSALEKQGVRHIIVVSHLGLPEDRRLARAVDGVDVIVGGHTHSYLGPDSKEGPYPVVEHAPSGQPVLVATAKFATEYLGELRVAFDGQGVPSHWQGGPRRLDASVTPDAAVESKVANYAKRLEDFRAAKLGAIDLDFPDGMEACRQGDCLAGLITTDAMLEYGRAHGAVAALLNGGSLRASMKRGELTQGDLLAVLPFGNMLVIREYSDEQLLAALEHGVSGEKAAGPRILQVSSLRYSVDATKSAGSRVLSAEISDARGQTRVLDKNTRYRVVLPSYLARGGDGYAMLVQGKSVSAPDPMDADVVGAYIKTHSPLKMPRTGRIDKATP